MGALGGKGGGTIIEYLRIFMTPKRIISDCCSLRMICNTHVQHATCNTQHRTCNTQHEAAHERHSADKSSPCGARCAHQTQRNATTDYKRTEGQSGAERGEARYNVERSGRLRPQSQRWCETQPMELAAACDALVRNSLFQLEHGGVPTGTS